MTIEERLEKLEKELMRGGRFNRWLLAGLSLVIVAWIVGLAFRPGTAAAQPAGASLKVISANRFVLVDDKGRPHAILGVDKDLTAMSFVDENGKPRATLGVDKDGPNLFLSDENGQSRAALAMKKGGPRLVLFDENGEPLAMLGTDKEKPYMFLRDSYGKVIWKTP